MAKTLFDNDYNLVNIFKEKHDLILGPNMSPDIVLGVGYDMNEFLSPIAKGRSFEKVEELENDDNLETESDLQSYTFKITKVETIQEEMEKFSINFSGSYGIVSGSLNYETTKNYFEKSDIFYLEFEANSGSSTIKNISNVKWENRPIAENIDDLDDRFKQFIADHGSHYVRTIFYGSKIIVRAKVNIKDSSFSQKVNASLKAVGSLASGSVDISYEHKETLKNSNLDLSISILGKLKSTSDENKNPIFRAISFEQLFVLISQIRDGETKIVSCPILCKLETYRFRLADLPKSKQIFTNVFTSIPASSPHGIPSGTIISWLPKIENCRLDDKGNVIEIIPPVGWIICDNNSEYNLEGYFLRGVVKYKDIKNRGGKETHLHSINDITGSYRVNEPPHGGGFAPGDYHHVHNISVNSSTAENIPPYFNVIYLIKI